VAIFNFAVASFAFTAKFGHLRLQVAEAVVAFLKLLLQCVALTVGRIQIFLQLFLRPVERGHLLLERGIFLRRLLQALLILGAAGGENKGHQEIGNIRQARPF